MLYRLQWLSLKFLFHLFQLWYFLQSVLSNLSLTIHFLLFTWIKLMSLIFEAFGLTLYFSIGLRLQTKR